MPYGGDLTWSAQGRPALVSDKPGAPAATQQQVEVLVMQAPRPFDVDGVAVGRPDNFFYPDRGGGLGAIVGTPASPKDIDAMRVRVQAGLAQVAGVAASPAPTVNESISGPTLVESVTCYTTGGDQITVTP